MSKTNVFRVCSAILLVVWCVLIFMFSAQNANESNQTSGTIVIKIIETIYPKYNTLSAQEQMNVMNVISLAVRKLAHFTEYFILGVWAFFVSVTFNRFKLFIRAALAFLFCAFYSISDEIHQHFVLGRACRFLDVLIDCTGVLVAITLITLIVKKSKISEKIG